MAELYAEKKPDNMTDEEWEKKQEGEEDDERVKFRVIMMILEAKRPNETAWDTLLTREAFEEMVKFEDFLYNLTLAEDYLDEKPPLPLGQNGTAPRQIGLADLCQVYNLTTEEMDEDLEEDCDKKKEYGCPVNLTEKCYAT